MSDNHHPPNLYRLYAVGLAYIRIGFWMLKNLALGDVLMESDVKFNKAQVSGPAKILSRCMTVYLVFHKKRKYSPFFGIMN